MSANERMVEGENGGWRMLALLSIAQLLGMSLWFAGSAVAGSLAADAGLGADAVGWLTSSVQLGFVAGTAIAAMLNLADIVPARRYFAIAAVAGALANASLIVTDHRATILGARFLTGFFLAGVYPPAMKMASTWFRARRGLAIGTVVGALTVGKATPYLVNAFPQAGPSTVIAIASMGALIAAALVATFYRDGPFAFPPRPFSWALVGEVMSQREWRLSTGGYLGHMFELYAFWTWIPAFIAASVAARAGSEAGLPVSALAFATIAVGGAGCIWGGFAADRRGREWLVTVSLAVSGSCALLVPFVYGQALWLVAAVALVWGFFVVADSAQFSALVTESVPPHAVGTALTVQTSIGFLLTMVSIQFIPPLVALVGWQWAFPILALGPAAGIAAVRRLRVLRMARLAHDPR